MLQKIVNPKRRAAGEINYKKLNSVHHESRLCNGRADCRADSRTRTIRCRRRENKQLAKILGTKPLAQAFERISKAQNFSQSLGRLQS